MTRDSAVKTRQLAHQARVFAQYRDIRCFALLWEMGLGKTKTILDVASHLHDQGRIDSLLICAPNAVYSNWITQEIPKHLGAEYIAMRFPKTDSDRDEAKRLMFLDPSFIPARKLRVLAISYDAARTDRGSEYLRKFTLIYRTMIVADESTAIANPSAQITKILRKIRENCHYAWIATGTPVTDGPFKIHQQIAFLDPDFWRRRGLRTLGAFKSHFGVFRQRRLGNRVFPELVEYQRLDELREMITPISSRLLKEDSEVELPPKTYALRTFEMLPRQREIYDRVRKDFVTDLDGGLILEAPSAITRLVRLQQITSGFVTGEQPDAIDTEDGPEIVRSMIDVTPPSENPRLQLLLGLIEEARHKVIVWCRFTREVDQICEALGSTAVRYDGQTTRRQREEALRRFCDPCNLARVLVANVAAISHGVTLTIAKTMIYYSNTFSLERRLQSEDRFHRIGQTSPVLIIDLAAEDSIDLKIVETLRKKYDVAARVTGDRLRQWIGAV